MAKSSTKTVRLVRIAVWYRSENSPVPVGLSRSCPSTKTQLANERPTKSLKPLEPPDDFWA